mgnify:CR=1 FL=1
MNPRIEYREKILVGTRDSSLLRFSLGNYYLKAGDPARASERFREATQRDPIYSAAWKALGKALAENGNPQGAREAYEQGIAVASARGDIQAAREMGVFAKRLAKAMPRST